MAEKISLQSEISMDNLIKTLQTSTMFHMSLGSKELFHSNFLHWISIVNWDVFLQIMRNLAGLKEDELFWWEKEDIKDWRGKPYRPNNNNVEVRREFHNFDLSIYILDSEKPAKEYQQPDNDESTDKEEIKTNGERMVQKWIPVLILENKMKSLPYEEQLKRYTQKAFDEWRTGEKIKTEARKGQDKVLDNKYGITFILLSLMESTLNNFEFLEEKVSKNPKYTLKLTSEWKHKTYNELLDSIERAKTMPSWSAQQQLNKDVVDDYSKFVKALYELAKNYWKIDPKKYYRNQIYPWKIKNEDAKRKTQEIEEYKKLRIHDIHEKLLYAQLLSLLESKLKNESLSFCRYSKEAIQEQSNQECPIRLYTNLSYAHGVGIFEVTYILSGQLAPQSGKKEIFKLIIQVQGDRYCHMVVYDDIVDDSGGKLCIKASSLEDAWKTAPKQMDITKIDDYISYEKNTPVFQHLSSSKNPEWGKYSNNLIYQYVEIPPDATIQDVITAMVNDIVEISKWFK